MLLRTTRLALVRRVPITHHQPLTTSSYFHSTSFISAATPTNTNNPTSTTPPSTVTNKNKQPQPPQKKTTSNPPVTNKPTTPTTPSTTASTPTATTATTASPATPTTTTPSSVPPPTTPTPSSSTAPTTKAAAPVTPANSSKSTPLTTPKWTNSAPLPQSQPIQPIGSNKSSATPPLSAGTTTTTTGGTINPPSKFGRRVFWLAVIGGIVTVVIMPDDLIQQYLPSSIAQPLLSTRKKWISDDVVIKTATARLVEQKTAEMNQLLERFKRYQVAAELQSKKEANGVTIATLQSALDLNREFMEISQGLLEIGTRLAEINPAEYATDNHKRAMTNTKITIDELTITRRKLEEQLAAMKAAAAAAAAIKPPTPASAQPSAPPTPKPATIAPTPTPVSAPTSSTPVTKADPTVVVTPPVALKVVTVTPSTDSKQTTPTITTTPSTGSIELDSLLIELGQTETELNTFVQEQDLMLTAEVKSLEREYKNRQVRDLASLESQQQYTLHSAITKQESRLNREHFLAHQPGVEQFKYDREFEEENKWRAKLYDALKKLNDDMSRTTDEWLQKEEAQLRSYFTTFIARLKNASAALDDGRLKELRAQLSLANHLELRSKQAHKLSAALLQLGEIVDKNHINFEAPWKVVQQVAKQDETLAKAIKDIDEDIVRRGIYSIASLKQAFHALSYDLKHSTFLPDRTDMWTVGREALAHLFATLTLNEAGGVIIPTSHIQPTVRVGSANPSVVAHASLSAIDSAHQEADYAHYINASTYLNSNALELALAELEAMQPARQLIMRQFMDELRKTVKVQTAIKVVRMRVLAMNAAAATNKL